MVLVFWISSRLEISLVYLIWRSPSWLLVLCLPSCAFIINQFPIFYYFSLTSVQLRQCTSPTFPQVFCWHHPAFHCLELRLASTSPLKVLKCFKKSFWMPSDAEFPVQSDSSGYFGIWNVNITSLSRNSRKQHQKRHVWRFLLTLTTTLMANRFTKCTVCLLQLFFSRQLT